MPPPIVNHSRDAPSEQPIISFALLHHVGGSPGGPGPDSFFSRDGSRTDLEFRSPSRQSNCPPVIALLLSPRRTSFGIVFNRSRCRRPGRRKSTSNAGLELLDDVMHHLAPLLVPSRSNPCAPT